MTKMKILLCSFLIFTFSYASENSVYDFTWLDKDKEIYVLQNRKFRKKGKLQVAASFGMTNARAYVDATSLQGRASFFFKEDYGIQFVYAKNDSKFNELANRVVDQNAVPYTRFIDEYKGVEFVWSPFYSKINIFDKILYYDWMFNIGYQSINTSDNRRQFTVTTDTALTEQSVNGFSIGTTFLFHITQSIGIRLDITQLRFNSDFFTNTNQSEKYWFKNTDITVGFNYKF